jgi:hypothetical protein
MGGWILYFSWSSSLIYRLLVLKSFAENSYLKKACTGRLACWLMPIVPDLGQQRSGGSQFKASLGKKLVRPHPNQKVDLGGMHL